jgi:hypothetical protein
VLGLQKILGLVFGRLSSIAVSFSEIRARTLKGITATLILEPSLQSRIHHDYLTIKRDSGQGDGRFGPFPMSNLLLDEASKKAHALEQDIPQVLLKFVNDTCNCLNEGIINLDKIAEDKLVSVVSVLRADYSPSGQMSEKVGRVLFILARALRDGGSRGQKTESVGSKSK